tara:strand:+ start:276 stop:653 length:378 start_codon:yes stop_codon:yes gene_type:complete
MREKYIMKKKLYKDMTREEKNNAFDKMSKEERKNIITLCLGKEYEIDALFENYDFRNDPNDYKQILEDRLQSRAEDLVQHSNTDYDDIEYYRIKNVKYISDCINTYIYYLNEFYEHSSEYELVSA